MGGLGYLDEEDTAFAADQEIAEYSGSGVLQKRFVRLPGSIDEAFLMIDVSGGSPIETWAHMDRLGSVIATTDSTGVTNGTYQYSPYGRPGSEGPSGFPFRFTGQRLDAETGLYYYKARYYDPETGRFMQTDPIGYADQMNLYAYVGNDPVNGIDPTGTCTGTRLKASGMCPGGLKGAHLMSLLADAGGGHTSEGASSQTGQSATGSTDRTWGSYLPGTQAGANATEYWANIAVNSDHSLAPLAHIPGVFAALWTDETAGDTAFTLGTAGVGSALNSLKAAMGPLRQWIRLGPSYSANLGQPINLSLRWGASPAKGGKYIQEIPSTRLQRFNQWLRGLKLPGGGWRTADPGHLHIKP